MFLKRPWILILFSLAFIFRVLLVTSAHHGDLNNNISWGQIAANNGMNGFYGSSNSDDWPYSAPNQPPLTILMFAATAKIWTLIKDIVWYLNWELLIFPSSMVWFWDEKGMDVLVKLPSIIADLAIAWIIYKYTAEKTKFKEITALTFSAIWLFNPVVWYNSSIWGQTDSIVNFLGLIAIFALLEKKLPKFGIFYTLSILFKGSLAIFAPILVTIVFIQKYSLKDYLILVLCILSTIFLVSVWFHPNLDLPIWLLRLYKNRILPGEIGFLTANAFNFWWIVDSGSTYDSQLFFGLPARVWGFIITLSINLITILFIVKSKLSYPRLFLALSVSALSSFLFMTRIHERYLYPFFPYATMLAVHSKEILIILIAVSFLHLINLYNLFWVPSLPFLEDILKNTNLASFISLLSLLLFIAVFRHLRISKYN